MWSGGNVAEMKSWDIFMTEMKKMYFLFIILWENSPNMMSLFLKAKVGGGLCWKQIKYSCAVILKGLSHTY